MLQRRRHRHAVVQGTRRLTLRRCRTISGPITIYLHCNATSPKGPPVPFAENATTHCIAPQLQLYTACLFPIRFAWSEHPQALGATLACGCASTFSPQPTNWAATRAIPKTMRNLIRVLLVRPYRNSTHQLPEQTGAARQCLRSLRFSPGKSRWPGPSRYTRHQASRPG